MSQVASEDAVGDQFLDGADALVRAIQPRIVAPAPISMSSK
jgi:hypothetical protein